MANNDQPELGGPGGVDDAAMGGANRQPDNRRVIEGNAADRTKEPIMGNFEDSSASEAPIGGADAREEDLLGGADQAAR